MGKLTTLENALLFAIPELSGTLPTGFCATILDLHGCSLVSNGTAALGGCNKLNVLDLSNNSLTNLPADLPPSLTHLYLGANPLDASAAELSAITKRTTGLVALDVVFLGLAVDLSSTRVTVPTGCRLGARAPTCAFVLRLYDTNPSLPLNAQSSAHQAVKVGGLKPNLTIGVGSQLRSPPLEDQGDGRYVATIPPSWAPNVTSVALVIRFFDGDSEFFLSNDEFGTAIGAPLRTVRYGAADCSAGAHTHPDPATGATCVCIDGFAPEDQLTSLATLNCHRVCAFGTTLSADGLRCECPTNTYNASAVGALLCVGNSWSQDLANDETLLTVQRNIATGSFCTPCGAINKCARCGSDSNGGGGTATIRAGWRTNASDVTSVVAQLEAARGGRALYIFRCTEGVGNNCSAIGPLGTDVPLSSNDTLVKASCNAPQVNVSLFAFRKSNLSFP